MPSYFSSMINHEIDWFSTRAESMAKQIQFNSIELNCWTFSTLTASPAQLVTLGFTNNLEESVLFSHSPRRRWWLRDALSWWWWLVGGWSACHAWTVCTIRWILVSLDTERIELGGKIMIKCLKNHNWKKTLESNLRISKVEWNFKINKCLHEF